MTIAAESSRKPAVVYPNSGESWDAEKRSWAGTATFGPEHAAVWVAVRGPIGRRVLPGRPVGDQRSWPGRRRAGRSGTPGRSRRGELLAGGASGGCLPVRCLPACACRTHTPSAMTASTSEITRPRSTRPSGIACHHGVPVTGDSSKRAEDRGEPGQREHRQPARDPGRSRAGRSPPATVRRRRVSSSTAIGRQRNATMLADPVDLTVGARPDRPVVLGEHHDHQQRRGPDARPAQRRASRPWPDPASTSAARIASEPTARASTPRLNTQPTLLSAYSLIVRRTGSIPAVSGSTCSAPTRMIDGQRPTDAEAGE